MVEVSFERQSSIGACSERRDRVRVNGIAFIVKPDVISDLIGDFDATSVAYQIARDRFRSAFERQVLEAYNAAAHERTPGRPVVPINARAAGIRAGARPHLAGHHRVRDRQAVLCKRRADRSRSVADTDFDGTAAALPKACGEGRRRAVDGQ